MEKDVIEITNNIAHKNTILRNICVDFVPSRVIFFKELFFCSRTKVITLIWAIALNWFLLGWWILQLVGKNMGFTMNMYSNAGEHTVFKCFGRHQSAQNHSKNIGTILKVKLETLRYAYKS